jgi:hypothetical protein
MEKKLENQPLKEKPFQALPPVNQVHKITRKKIAAEQHLMPQLVRFCGVMPQCLRKSNPEKTLGWNFHPS